MTGTPMEGNLRGESHTLRNYANVWAPDSELKSLEYSATEIVARFECSRKILRMSKNKALALIARKSIEETIDSLSS